MNYTNHYILKIPNKNINNNIIEYRIYNTKTEILYLEHFL